MLDRAIEVRVRELIHPIQAERKEQLAKEIQALQRRAAATGQIGALIHQVFDKCSQELQDRATMVWGRLKEVFEIHGCPTDNDTRADLKREVEIFRQEDFLVLSGMFTPIFQQCLGRREVPDEFSLQRITNRIRDKINAEIDLYMDGMIHREKREATRETNANATLFVSVERLGELKALNSEKLDLQRLIKMCEEVNVCAKGDCPHAVIMLIRAILDHVPPVFAVNSFGQVGNNYAGSKSFKQAMARLDESSRRIADMYLHVQIRKKESVATMTQANFSSEIDLLLSEVVRILR